MSRPALRSWLSLIVVLIASESPDVPFKVGLEYELGMTMTVSTRTGDADSEGLARRAVRGIGGQGIVCIVVQAREGRFWEEGKAVQHDINQHVLSSDIIIDPELYPILVEFV